MNITVSDIDVLSDDGLGNNRVVVFFEKHVDLEVRKIFSARAVLANDRNVIECEAYLPLPNNESETPHLHLRADNRLGLREKLRVGDTVIVGD